MLLVVPLVQLRLRLRIVFRCQLDDADVWPRRARVISALLRHSMFRRDWERDVYTTIEELKLGEDVKFAWAAGCRERDVGWLKDRGRGGEVV